MHWTLPRPLRHAPDATRGGEGWPFVPNRWVVVRIAGGEAKSEPVKVWIVCSDAPNGSSPFVSTEGGVPTGTKVGKSVVMTASLTGADLPVAAAPVLKAVGPGSATFAVFTPGVRDVFALHDDLQRDDGTTIAKGTFTYHVAGWYAAPVQDPLAEVEWEPPREDGASVDRTFGFVVWLGAAPAPTRMLVHAMRSGVAWDSTANNPKATKYPENVPQEVRVAVGNTAVDALAALVRLSGDPTTEQTRADLLEAFQYGLLDAFETPASSVVLDREIRRHWYPPGPAGRCGRSCSPSRPGRRRSRRPLPRR